MSHTHTARGVGAGVAALLVFGAAGWVASAWPPPDPAQVDAPVAALPPAPTSLICPARPLTVAGSVGPADPDAPVGDTSVRTVTRVLTFPEGQGSAPSAALAAGSASGAAAPLEPVGRGRGLEIGDPAAPSVLTVEPLADRAGEGGGVTVSRTDAGDLRGLTGAACILPQTTTWLVGGSTEVGSSARLVLTNPSSVAAAADVTVWTSTGLADAPGLAGLVVPPRGSIDVLVESAVTDPAIALRVQASGGQLAATLETTGTEGLAAGGVSVVTPADEPTRELLVPGLLIGGGEEAVVRVVNPSQQTATAAIALLGGSGEEELTGATDVVLDPGAVVDVPLTGVPPGAWAVRVSSDVALTGGLGLRTTATSPAPGTADLAVDTAWVPARDPSSAPTLVMPAEELGLAATLAVTNPGEVAARVSVVDPVSDGATLGVVDVGPGRTVSVEVPADARGVRVLAEAEPGWEAPLAGEVPTGESPTGESRTSESPTGGEASSAGSAPGESSSGAPSDILATLVLRVQAPDGELVEAITPAADLRFAGALAVIVR